MTLVTEDVDEFVEKSNPVKIAQDQLPPAKRVKMEPHAQQSFPEEPMEIESSALSALLDLSQIASNELRKADSSQASISSTHSTALLSYSDDSGRNRIRARATNCLADDDKLSPEASEIMRDWFLANIDHPYPNRDTKKRLAASTVKLLFGVIQPFPMILEARLVDHAAPAGCIGDTSAQLVPERTETCGR